MNIIFYVFGSDEPSKHMIASECSFMSGDLDEAYEKYAQYCLENRWEHCYLVVDFGLSKPKLFSISSLDVDNDIIPFFIIGEYHAKSDNREIIRRDSCITKLDNGFEHEFIDNLAAMREFLYFFNKDIDVSLGIVYQKVIEDNICIFERKIADTKSIMKTTKPKYVRRFNLSMSDWKPIPLTEGRFVTFVINNNNKYVVSSS